MPGPLTWSASVFSPLALALALAGNAASAAEADTRTGDRPARAARPVAARSPVALPESPAEVLHARCAPAVVGIRCRKARNVYFGTGTIIDPSGLVLTSVTVVPPGASGLEVFLRGGREAEARLVDDEEAKELSLLRILRPESLLAEGEEELPYLRLGESRSLRLGAPVYSLGNSFQSIERDDQVAIAAGVVSGLFRLDEKRSQSTYVGAAVETSAALNNGMDGGPLLDTRGQLVGLLSLNYARSRWLGTAVPVDVLKPVIGRHRDWYDDRRSTVASRRRNEALRNVAGVELEEVAGDEVRVLRVRPDGPAAEAGIRPGDRIVRMEGEELESLDAFRRFLRESEPGARLDVTVERSMSSIEVEIGLWARF